MNNQHYTMEQLEQAVEYYKQAVEEHRRRHGDQYADESLANGLLKMFEEIILLEQMDDDEALAYTGTLKLERATEKPLSEPSTNQDGE